MVWFYLVEDSEGRLTAADFPLSIPLWSDFIFLQQTKQAPGFLSFNPTMVWFYPRGNWRAKEYISTLSIPLWSDFILYTQSGITIHSLPFQSHYGLILSLIKCVTEIINCYPFNPTMVWFYLTTYRGSSSWAELSIPLWSDFIEQEYDMSGKSENGFQSHYGLILSITTYDDLSEYLATFNPTMVWFYRACVFGLRGTGFFLSIPLWSDFILMSSQWRLKIINSFQSHYGLILSRGRWLRWMS